MKKLKQPTIGHCGNVKALKNLVEGQKNGFSRKITAKKLSSASRQLSARNNPKLVDS